MKNKRFNRNDISGIPVFQSEILGAFKEISHGFTSRKGGYSTTPYESLNVGIAVGDMEENVRKNRGLLAEISCSESSVYLLQVHESDILIINKDNNIPHHDIVKADAVITDRAGIALVIQTADCQAVLLYDPVKKVAGAVHSGWRGNVVNVLGKTARKMVDAFGSHASDIRAVIGPSLGPCCAEFINFRSELPEAFWKYGDSKHLFNFWEISKCQLEKAGLLSGNIFISGLCTRCSEELFFSYRGAKKTGRMAGFISINDSVEEYNYG